jgi:hypothetical protein
MVEQRPKKSVVEERQNEGIGRAGPPLIHIGYHKTGTSWLQKFLFRNARAGFMWTGKGTDSPVNRLVATPALDFDPKAAEADFASDADRAARRGLVFVVSLERLSGHPFSGGYDSKEIAHRLRAVFPHGRVLVVIREQRSMILSTYKQYVYAGGPLPLHRFLDPPTYRRPRIPHFDHRHFEYHRLLALYQSLFGEQNVLALPYEGFQADPRAFVTSIAELAGRTLEDEELESLPYARRPNRARGGSIVRTTRLINRFFVRSDLNPAPLVASTRAEALCRSCAPAVDRVVPRRFEDRFERRLRATIEDVVGDRYAESNRTSSKLIGADLGAFGYDMGARHSVRAEDEALALR